MKLKREEERLLPRFLAGGELLLIWSVDVIGHIAWTIPPWRQRRINDSQPSQGTEPSADADGKCRVVNIFIDVMSC